MLIISQPNNYYYYVLYFFSSKYYSNPLILYTPYPLFHSHYTTSQLSYYLTYYCYASLSHAAEYSMTAAIG